MARFPQQSGGGSGTIAEITSTGGSITITDPTGPDTNLEVTGGGSGTVTSVASPDNSVAVATGTTTPKLTGGVPAGDRTAITTPIAYTDPISGDAVQVLTLSKETTAIAIGRSGLAYPEIVFRPAGSQATDSGAPIFAFGDGTFDPANNERDSGQRFRRRPLGGTSSGYGLKGMTITAPTVSSRSTR